jgi:hypothetical protein
LLQRETQFAPGGQDVEGENSVCKVCQLPLCYSAYIGLDKEKYCCDWWLAMADLTKGKGVVGSSFHISDCYIWAEIFYLDSSSDYREYLPQNSRRSLAGSDSDLIMLDDSIASSRSSVSLTAVGIILLLFSLAAGCFIYLLADLL